jgi:hypothetical protein
MRRAIARHLIDTGHFQMLIAESENLVVSVAMHNDVHLVLLFDPAHIGSTIDLKNFLRQKRPRMRIRILPSQAGALMPGWAKVIDDALKPVKRRKRSLLQNHPRFRWKPEKET